MHQRSPWHDLRWFHRTSLHKLTGKILAQKSPVQLIKIKSRLRSIAIQHSPLAFPQISQPNSRRSGRLFATAPLDLILINVADDGSQSNTDQ
jgi:hypothetical protein